MSWQDYVDKQLLASRCVTKAAIAGHDGNVWAKSEGFDVSHLYISYAYLAVPKHNITSSKLYIALLALFFYFFSEDTITFMNNEYLDFGLGLGRMLFMY